MVKTVVLISCVKRKRDCRSKAKDLYISPLFRAERAYAEKFADTWYILSAKHHLLDPEKEICPYEQTLNDANATERRKWSNEVFASLQRCTSPDDKIIMVAGEKYCQYLVPLIEKRGNPVLRPTRGYSMGRIPGRLQELMSKEKSGLHMSFQDCNEIEIFYEMLDELLRRINGPRRVSELRRDSSFPTRGVYFYYEDGQMRPGSPTLRRVVRIGTHGLKKNSKSTLYERLCRHRGTKAGGGNHRGSIFRHHVGIALINKFNIDCPTWIKKKPTPEERLAERPLEEKVSQYIGNMQVAWLSIPDKPSRLSLRGYIERNAIGLLSGKEPATRTWMGNQTRNPEIQRSYLWNVKLIDHELEPDFLEVFRNQLRRMPNS